MKKMLQKSLVLMLVLISMVSACAMPAFALDTQSTTVSAHTENAETDFACVVLSDGTIEIAGYTGTSSEVVIPEFIDGKKVTSIGNSAFFKNSLITNVTIPSGAVRIGNYSFGYCDSLRKITIPSSVTSIAQNAFINHSDELVVYCFNDSTATNFVQQNNMNHAHFKYRVIGDGIAEIVCYYDNAKVVEIPETIDGNVVTAIGNSAFIYSDVTDVTIPDTVTKIDDLAFCQCASLKSVKMPQKLTYLGNHAFGYCSSLIEIEIPQGIRIIDSYAFCRCSSLKNVVIPDEVEYIFEGAFTLCTSLESVTIPESMVYICEYNFEECCDSLVIKGVSGTYAEKYAGLNGLNFVIK